MQAHEQVGFESAKVFFDRGEPDNGWHLLEVLLEQIARERDALRIERNAAFKRLKAVEEALK